MKTDFLAVTAGLFGLCGLAALGVNAEMEERRRIQSLPTKGSLDVSEFDRRYTLTGPATIIYRRNFFGFSNEAILSDGRVRKLSETVFRGHAKNESDIVEIVIDFVPNRTWCEVKMYNSYGSFQKGKAQVI